LTKEDGADEGEEAAAIPVIPLPPVPIPIAFAILLFACPILLLFSLNSLRAFLSAAAQALRWAWSRAMIWSLLKGGERRRGKEEEEEEEEEEVGGKG
jgi:hypothetical protein